MKITFFSKYIFWSYKKDADLPERVVIRQVILYGEVKDMLALTKLVNKTAIKNVLEKLDDRYKKRRNFIEKVILA